MNSAHFEGLPQKTREVFALIQKMPLIQDFYLAGGTAAAIHLGHRISADLDFFSQKDFNENRLVKKLSELGQFQLDKKTEQTVIGTLNDTKISFLGYHYPLLRPPILIKKIKVADILDIACMKIDTIASRGAKRDFIDLYFIAKEVLPLSKILEAFKKKYTSINYNMMHIKKSLVYFNDAESDPMPNMLKSVAWKDVIAFFERA